MVASAFCVTEVNDFLKILDQRADEKNQALRRYIAEETEMNWNSY